MIRPVVPGSAGGAMAPPIFGTSVNPISTKGADYAPHITTGTPRFSDRPTVLMICYLILNMHVCPALIEITLLAYNIIIKLIFRIWGN